MHEMRKKIRVISIYGMKGRKKHPIKELRKGKVSLWMEVDSLDLTPEEARKLARVLNKAADKAEKVGK